MEFTKEQMSKALDEAYKKAGHNAYFANGFEAGVVFAQEQFKILNIPCVTNSALRAKVEKLEKENEFLKFMVDNGLGEDDLKNDITLPHDI